jgi:biopolymer transport protein ExbB/TolQ
MANSNNIRASDVGAYFTEQYFTLRLHLIVLFTLVLILLSRLYWLTYFLLIFTIHIINIMSQHHEQQQERSRLKNQTKALYQATRHANPVVRSLEQSYDTGQKHIARGARGARTKARTRATSQHQTASSSKRGAGGARTRAASRHRETSSSKTGPSGEST